MNSKSASSTAPKKQGEPETIRRAVYAGSFDPITNGHMYMIREGAELFDEMIVAMGTNPTKKYTFPMDTRLDFLEACTREFHNVRVMEFTNRFLVDFAKEVGARFILRGIRNPQDFEFERAMSTINREINTDTLHVFLMPPRESREISSSFVKGLVGPKGWRKIVRQFIPHQIYDDFVEFYEKNSGLKNGDALTGVESE